MEKDWKEASANGGTPASAEAAEIEGFEFQMEEVKDKAIFSARVRKLIRASIQKLNEFEYGPGSSQSGLESDGRWVGQEVGFHGPNHQGRPNSVTTRLSNMILFNLGPMDPHGFALDLSITLGPKRPHA